MGVTKTEQQFEQVVRAECDNCGCDIKVQFGHMEDHMKIGGYHDGKLLEAVVCVPCMIMIEDMTNLKIKRRGSTIGHC